MDRTAIQDVVKSLTSTQRSAFAALCAQRLLKEYKDFVTKANWGDCRPLEEGLEAVWRHISGRRVELERVRKLSKACQRVAPDSDRFPRIRTGAAQNAVVAVDAALQSCVSDDPGEAHRAAAAVRDTVDAQIVFRLGASVVDEFVEKRIAEDPLMQAALQRESDDIQAVSRVTSFTPETVAGLRRRLESEA